MSDTHEYRCLACMEATVARDFDVSHLSRTCDACGEFGRFVNTIVLDQYDALEADPPAELHWDRLDRPQKFMIAERLTRQGYTIDDFDIEIHDEEDGDDGDDETDRGTGTDDADDDTDGGDDDADDDTDGGDDDTDDGEADTDDGAAETASSEADRSDADAGD